MKTTTETAAQALAEELLDRWGDQVQRRGEPLWLTVARDGAGALDAGGARRRKDLYGWTAPAGVEAVAAIATGRLRPLSESVEMPAPVAEASRRPVRLCYVVDRNGEVGWRMLTEGRALLEDPPAEGRVLDLLHRVLGLATPPSRQPVGALYSSVWLAHIATMEGDRRLRWPEALAWHPLVLAKGMAAEALDAPAGVEEFVIRRSLEDRWEPLRRAAGRSPDGWIPARLARWMDEGMFARETVAQLPGIGAVLTAVRPLLTPAAARRLTHVVHRASGGGVRARS